ncbi:TPA: epoxyqueuosine reductase, partial [Enterococcus faecalis]|nr:epoxyqueuosine reductase [Enterococcus faecalis]
MPTLKEKIIQESQRLGIDKIGFTHAEPFIELEDSLHEQRERGYNS